MRTVWQLACAVPLEEHTGTIMHVWYSVTLMSMAAGVAKSIIIAPKGLTKLFPSRRFPPQEYRELQFAHKGPLSKTVTLTYPFNPFNKLE